MSGGMFGHTLFCRTFALFKPNNKLVFTHRINHVNVKAPWRELRMDIKSLVDNHKIPEKPKRPLTAYFKFMLERRPIVLRQNPSIHNTEVARIISEQWKVLNAVDKAKYEESALQDKEKYNKEILNYNAKLTPEQEDILHKIETAKRQDRKKRRMNRENKTMGKPKRPPTSFSLFVQENAGTAKSGSNVVSDAHLKWNEMSSVEKEKYQLAYQRNKEKYEIELAEWETAMLAEGKSHLVRVKTLEEHGLSKKDNQQKPKRETNQDKHSK